MKRNQVPFLTNFDYLHADILNVYAILFLCQSDSILYSHILQKCFVIFLFFLSQTWFFISPSELCARFWGDFVCLGLFFIATEILILRQYRALPHPKNIIIQFYLNHDKLFQPLFANRKSGSLLQLPPFSAYFDTFWIVQL